MRSWTTTWSVPSCGSVGTAATATSPRHFGSLEHIECMQRPKPRTMASLICVHSFLGCPLIAEGLSWKSPANKENDKQRNNNWSLMQHANRSRCVIQQARHHRWSRMDDWAAMLDFPAEIQSNKLNFAFTIGNFTKGRNPHWTTIRSDLKNSLEQSWLDDALIKIKFGSK